MSKRKLGLASWILAMPALILSSGAGLGHPGHDDALTELQAVWRGKSIIRILVKRGALVEGESLDESWNDIDGDTGCSATRLYYIVSLENPSAGKTLHLLLDHSGRFRRARFDSDFVELRSSPPKVGCGI